MSYIALITFCQVPGRRSGGPVWVEPAGEPRERRQFGGRGIKRLGRGLGCRLCPTTPVPSFRKGASDSVRSLSLRRYLVCTCGKTLTRQIRCICDDPRTALPMSADVVIHPLVPLWMLAAALAAASLLPAVASAETSWGCLLTELALATLGVALLDPRIVREQRPAASDLKPWSSLTNPRVRKSVSQKHDRNCARPSRGGAASLDNIEVRTIRGGGGIAEKRAFSTSSSGRRLTMPGRLGRHHQRWPGA